MFTIKSVIGAAAIGFVVAFLLSFGITHSYDAARYEAKEKTLIAKQEQELSARKSDLIAANNKVLEIERSNNETTNHLNQKILEQQALLASQSNLLSKFRSQSGGLSIRGNCSAQASSSAPDSTSSPAADNSSNVCELSPKLSDLLSEAFTKVEQLNIYASACHEYAVAIEKQREEITKENK